jgi:ATP-dependent helicase/DNAse subunit B
LPIKGGFSDEKSSIQKKYQLKGTTLDDFEVACISDDRFTGEAVESDIVEVKFKLQKGEKIPSGYSKIASAREINNFGVYAMKLIAKACDDISKLNITPCPLVLSKDPCKTCVYSALCRFDRSFQNTKREAKAKILKENFEEQ